MHQQVHSNVQFTRIMATKIVTVEPSLVDTPERWKPPQCGHCYCPND